MHANTSNPVRATDFLMGNSPYVRKIKFGRHWRPTHHRSGWGHAMDSLDCLHGPEGVLLDGFVEKKFAWGSDPGDRCNAPVPYREPWIGFLHNPPNMPEVFNLASQNPRDILKSDTWLDSLVHCQGLFTLSVYLRDWLQLRVPVPVCSLLHPTAEPDICFSPKKYFLNPEKNIVQVGWWLRKFKSLYELDVPTLKKTLLNVGDPWIDAVHDRELEFIDPARLGSVYVEGYLDNDAYDDLLSCNIVFLDLYDSSANNALVECIARATPVLINPLPAVVEYLGDDYPFYFSTLDEAAKKAQDETLVLRTHGHIKANPIRQQITRQSFIRSMVESEIYRGLPTPRRPPRETATVEDVPTDDLHATLQSFRSELPTRESLIAELEREWRRALSGDGQARAHWQIVEPGGWTWEEDGIVAASSGNEWSAYQWSRCDSQMLRALKDFAIEVTLSGVAECAGISFGREKDFLVELGAIAASHRLRVEVNSDANTWTFLIDGLRIAGCAWNCAIQSSADILRGDLTLKSLRAEYVLFQDLSVALV